MTAVKAQCSAEIWASRDQEVEIARQLPFMVANTNGKAFWPFGETRYVTISKAYLSGVEIHGQLGIKWKTCFLRVILFKESKLFVMITLI